MGIIGTPWLLGFGGWLIGWPWILMKFNLNNVVLGMGLEGLRSKRDLGIL